MVPEVTEKLPRAPVEPIVVGNERLEAEERVNPSMPEEEASIAPEKEIDPKEVERVEIEAVPLPFKVKEFPKEIDPPVDWT